MNQKAQTAASVVQAQKQSLSEAFDHLNYLLTQIYGNTRKDRIATLLHLDLIKMPSSFTPGDIQTQIRFITALNGALRQNPDITVQEAMDYAAASLGIGAERTFVLAYRKWGEISYTEILDPSESSEGFTTDAKLVDVLDGATDLIAEDPEKKEKHSILDVLENLRMNSQNAIQNILTYRAEQL